MSKLVSVIGDEETHGGGALSASNNPGKLFAGGKLVNLIDSSASSDAIPHPSPLTNASTGGSKLFVAGIAVHRDGDSRYCGATTVTPGQAKLYAN